MSKTSQLDRYSLMIVSKYFKNIGDFIKIIKVCKKFQEVPAMFRYNPIYLFSHFNFFPNVETYHLYKKNECPPAGYFHYVYEYPISYTDYLKKKSPNSTFTHVNYTLADFIKYKKHEGATHLCGQTFQYYEDKKVGLDLSGIVSLGNYGFHNCSTLTSIILNKRVRELPPRCFNNCLSLKDIDISNVKIIGDVCFGSCTKLTAITLGEVLSVGHESFYDAFNIKSVKSVGTTKLDALINLSSSKAFGSIPHKLLISAMDIRGLNDDQKINAFQLPADEYGIDAFQGVIGIEEMDIPKSVTRIRSRALMGTKIKKLDLSNVVKINDNDGLDEVTALTIPADLEFDSLPFLSNLKSIKSVRGNSLVSPVACFMKEILEKVGLTCKQFVYTKKDFLLTNGVIPDFCGRIAFNVFNDVDVLNIEIPKTVSSLGWGNFTDCKKVEKITILSETNDTIYIDSCPNLLEITINSTGRFEIVRCKKLEKVIFKEIPSYNKRYQPMFLHCRSLREIFIETPPKDLVYRDRMSYDFVKFV
ncbi:hypothetical protein EIN_024870, partial [Entamoeba invadens IP1]|uniref:hypothetical protein n=1 Tax=Entamoeba invadens IP1 TaxID=370355 RepID=UPI0002C3DD0E